jgi:hypothetical protein
MNPAQWGEQKLASVELYWLPLGAGDASHCVRWNGRIFEVIASRSHHRQSCDLYHSALIVRLGGDCYTIEMAPEVVPSSVELRWRPRDHQAAFMVSS